MGHAHPETPREDPAGQPNRADAPSGAPQPEGATDQTVDSAGAEGRGAEPEARDPDAARNGDARQAEEALDAEAEAEAAARAAEDARASEHMGADRDAGADTDRDTETDADAARGGRSARETRESREFRLSQDPSALWPILADLDRLFEAIDLPRFQTVESAEDAAPRRHSGLQGSRGLEWTEAPTEWVAGQWWRVERRFLRGPLRRLEITLYLRRSAGGGSLAQFQLIAEPNGVIGATMLSSGHLRRLGDAFHRRAEEADDFLAGRRDTPFALKDAPRSREAARALEERTRKMAASAYANGAAEALAGMIAKAPDSELREIRIRRLARVLELPERAAAEAALAAAAAGLLRRRYVALCPRCRQAAGEAASMADLPATETCERDALRFPVDLAVNVEVLLSPDPAVRTIGEGAFAHEAPMSAPHLIVRQLLEPGERRAFPYAPRPGAYRARLEDPNGAPLGLGGQAAAFDVSLDHPGGPFPVVAAMPSGLSLNPAPGDDALIFENHCRHARLIALERREWRADAVTAAELAALQAMRELAPTDAPRRPTPAGHAVFAAFELAERAGVFARLGDVETARRLSRLMQRAARMARARNGGLAKRGAEKGLAVFLDAADAVGFAVDLRQAARAILADSAADEDAAATSTDPAAREEADSLEPGAAALPEMERVEFANQGEGGSLALLDDHALWRPQLAVGVAAGRAVAVGSGSGVDYTGFAPALAERLAAESDPGELTLAADLLEDVEAAARVAGLRRSEADVVVPGLGAPIAVVRAQ